MATKGPCLWAMGEDLVDAFIKFGCPIMLDSTGTWLRSRDTGSDR